MQLTGAGGQAGAAGTNAVAQHHLRSKAFHLWVIAQIQIGVGGQQQHFPPLPANMRALRPIQHLKRAV